MIKKFVPFLLIWCFISLPLIAQHTVEQHKEGKFSYTTVKGDPLGVRIYTLANGLKVYMSVNKNQPRIQTLISVRAGSKNDPADATGLAHYLEHMLFKGTDRYGSLDFAKEKSLIDQIENLYEQYRATKDEAKRAALYHVIDSVSGVAAKYAIPNEYDKMLNSLGAKGTNAHTSVEETVYENDIPSNQLRTWLKVEAERFRNPILRLFHTELEAVYEEKNRTLDNDNRQANEAMMAALFQKHSYGTQTTIGTVEHLKNPSMKKIREYYYKHYVPNNMAIILAGDFDPAQAIQWIDENFSSFQKKPVEPFNPPQEDPITSPIVREVFGPTAENVRIVFRFPGASAPEIKYLTMCDMILSNSATGLIDLNLKQQQKVLNPGCSPSILKDYSYHQFRGNPRKGQKLEEVAELLLAQIEELKQGKFDEETMKAILTNMKIERMKAYESDENRVNILSQAFIQGREWRDEVAQLDELSTITRQQVIDFAKKWYNSNYVIIYKRTGENKNIQKVPKPPITPLTINRGMESDFVKSILSQKAEKINPRFTDFAKDIQKGSLNSGVPVRSIKNTENKLFTLRFVWEMGSRDDKKTGLALQLLDYMGTASMSGDELKQRFYALGCELNTRATTDQFVIELSGLADNFVPALKLTEDLLANAQCDEQAMKFFVEGVIKQRANMKKNKDLILNQALVNYAVYGKRNPFSDVMSEKDLRATTVQELTQKLKELNSIEHKVLYYGPATVDELIKTIKPLHHLPATMKPPVLAEPYTVQNMNEGGVLFLDYDMVQAEVQMRLKCDVGYNPANAPYTRLFNEYFGGGSMSSVTFQTMRESKALAYSVDAYFAPPRKKNDPYFMTAYIGTQADKLPEALAGMNELLNGLPQIDELFANSKQSILNKIESERITRMDLLDQFENLTRVGLDHDIRKDVYDKVPALGFNDILKFHDSRMKDKKFSYMVIGSKKKLNMDELKKYGTVKEVTTEEVFGY